MRRKVRFGAFVAVVCAVVVMGAPVDGTADETSAEEIIDSALEKNGLELESARAEMELVVEDDNGERSEKKMTMQSKAVDGSVRTLVELTHPEDLKGQSFLFAENESGEDDVWMYVPAFEVTRRIEGSKKQGAFLGSHFTYNDLESRDVEEASYTKIGDEKVGKHPVHVIRATPEDSAQSAYGKIRVYVRKSDDVPLRMKFFDDSDELVKTLYVRKIDETDAGRTYIKQMQMHSAKGGYTLLTIRGLETDVDLPASAFNKEQLGK